MIAEPETEVIDSDCRAALENIAHLTRKICAIWGSPELDTFLSRLLMDARDGTRQGLPMAVAAEIMFLARTNKMIRAMDLSSKLNLKVEETFRMVDEGDQARLKVDALDDPLVSRDTVTRANFATDARRSAQPTAVDQAVGISKLMMMLIRSKWLAWAIVVVLGLKFVWPTVKALI